MEGVRLGGTFVAIEPAGALEQATTAEVIDRTGFLLRVFINRYVCHCDIVRLAHEKIRTLKACGYAAARMDARNTNRAAARDRFTYLTFVLPLTLILSATLYFLPSPTLFQILHLLFGVALLQFIGCLIDARRQ